MCAKLSLAARTTLSGTMDVVPCRVHSASVRLDRKFREVCFCSSLGDDGGGGVRRGKRGTFVMSSRRSTRYIALVGPGTLAPLRSPTDDRSFFFFFENYHSS